MLFEVGTRFPIDSVACRGEECKEKQEPIQPGVPYEIVVEVDPPIKREELWKLAEVYREIQRRLPGITILYIGVSDDGRYVYVQVADPEPGSYVPWNAIAVIVAAICAALIAYMVYQAIVVIVGFLSQKLPPSPSWLGPVVWAGVGLALVGGGIYLATKGISSLARSVRGG